ncbi:MAG: TetR/AcrR family transcriptional regulator [Myxococcales bacterium]|nr:TetR/AcrR family transcriptional regulator [Myxococcales bacterium]
MYHHGDLRRALVEAAEALLEAKGPDGVSMRGAARSAGVSSAAPYKHFRDRDELMSALAARGHAACAAEAHTAMAEASGPLEQLRAQGVTTVQFAIRRPAMFRVMNVAKWIRPGASAEMDAVLAAEATRTESLAREAAASGELVPEGLDASVLACRALVYGLARMYVDGHAEQLGILDADPDDLVVRVVDVIGLGLIPRP